MNVLPTNGNCTEKNIVTGNGYRFTMLTPQCVRMEYALDNIFEDRPTQLVLNRCFDPVHFLVNETAECLEIDTEFLSIRYNKKAFAPGGLSVKVLSPSKGIYTTWHFGDVLDENLGGTARTLDQADGAIELENGLMSRLQGYSVLDDSTSLVLLENGWIEPRKKGIQDFYFFGYGYAYQQCLNDFFHLTGKTPLLPRYALGNWWSRFYAYSEQDYNTLMNHFEAESIPLSVAVLDMDWHVTQIPAQYGKGWTGYTWNTELFQNPKSFLNSLHQRGLKVTLNLHPAEGIQPHEKQYRNACEMLGLESDKNLPIHFDFCSPEFIRVYFEQLLRPEEEQGVDFWWIDWQQGLCAKYEGADPLWLLNHFHFLHSAQNNARPLILSRYAGAGSHRYPIGFSGDSIISWQSLDFQPYFTATAANIGYAWWSHDIGGHCGGVKDEALMVRWVQLGVFSPILRLHSTSNLFNGKEPWNYSASNANIMGDFLRLRHQLIPYLYTMNFCCAQNNRPLVLPVYYNYPESEEAYSFKNQFEFGSQLMVCPITTPQIPKLHLAKVAAWLPQKLYFDFFTGLCYRGQRVLQLYRPLDFIPVLAPAGAIVPLTSPKEAALSGTNLPQSLAIKVFAGDNGFFELYEDDGETNEWQHGAYALTKFFFTWNEAGKSTFTLMPVEGMCELLPKNRSYTVSLLGIQSLQRVSVTCNGCSENIAFAYDAKRGMATVQLPICDTHHETTLVFDNAELLQNDVLGRVFNLLEKMEIGYELKERIYNCLASKEKNLAFCELQTLQVCPDVLGAISEILFAY